MADSGVRIRRALADDIGGILRVDNFAERGDQDRAEFLSRSVDLRECLVYLHHGSVAGYVALKPAHGTRYRPGR